MMARWERWDAHLARAELWLLTAGLSLMISVAFVQIVLRNALATGLSWGGCPGALPGAVDWIHWRRRGHAGGHTHPYRCFLPKAVR